MAFNHNKKLANDYCGTAYAAKILGLSVGTIQALVEKNELQAWRTQGGHRRISMHSIHEFLNKNNMKGIPIETQDTRLRVLIVDDDAISRDLLRGYFEKSDFPVDFAIMPSGMEALIDISSINPDLLITDLEMPGIDGFELLRILRQNPHFDRMIIMVLSALTAEEVASRGALAKDSIYAAKPVQADWFNGFLTGIIAGRLNVN